MRKRKLKNQKYKQKKIIIIGSLSLLLFLCIGYAAFNIQLSLRAKGNIKIRRDYYVSNNGNDKSGYGSKEKPYKTIQKAYDMAPSNTQVTIYVMSDLTVTSTINFDKDKIIKLTSYNNINNKSSLIRDSTFTSYMLNQTKGDLALENIILDGNNVPAEWPIVFIGSTASVENGSIFKNANNQKDYGGAIWVNGGTLTINGGEFSNNKTVAGGSAIFVSGENVTAVVHHLGTLIMNDGLITNNKAWNGAIYNDGHTTINGGIISNNTADLWGGGIWSNGTLIINNGTITGNKVIGSDQGNYGGGGIFYKRGSTFKQIGGTVSNNTPNNIATDG